MSEKCPACQSELMTTDFRWPGQLTASRVVFDVFMCDSQLDQLPDAPLRQSDRCRINQRDKLIEECFAALENYGLRHDDLCGERCLTCNGAGGNACLVCHGNPFCECEANQTLADLRARRAAMK